MAGLHKQINEQHPRFVCAPSPLSHHVTQENGLMSDIIFTALGCGTLIVLAYYALALDRL